MLQERLINRFFEQKTKTAPHQKNEREPSFDIELTRYDKQHNEKPRNVDPRTAQQTAPPKPALIQTQQLIKTYASDAGEFTVLKGIDLQISAGEFVAIVGKSGSGKSTLINMITGIDHPTSGQVTVGDVAVHKLSENKMAVWRGKTIGLVFQFFQLLPALTVLQNVTLPMDFCGVIPARKRKDRAMHLLEQVDMVEHANKLPSALSGGQQQRVAIARALANDPPIIIADEPTGNLDSRTADAVFQLFRSLVAQGKTIVMVTHDDDIAQKVSRALTVVDGQITSDTQID